MGLHLVPNNLAIDFVGYRKISYAISVIIIVLGIASLIIKGGPQYGIDFAGGTIVQVQFSKPIADEELKNALKNSSLPDLTIQQYGSDSLTYLLRFSVMEETAEGLNRVITEALSNNLKGNSFTIPRLETVGPKVGADLRGKALEAMYIAILITAVYISGRFEYRWFSAALMAVTLAGGMAILNYFEVSKVYMVVFALAITIFLCWKLKLVFAMGAIVSILHDVLITVGIFSICNKEFDLTIIAALLTLVGYSLNDTIIVYDRIRENLRKNTEEPLSVIINRSINQTLSRTVLTSGTTLAVILALLIFGGDILFDFSLVMFLGVFIGTASSMFVASPILLAFGDTVVSHAHIGQDNRPRDADGRLAPQV